jgi:hypothetical protein
MSVNLNRLREATGKAVGRSAADGWQETAGPEAWYLMTAGRAVLAAPLVWWCFRYEMVTGPDPWDGDCMGCSGRGGFPCGRVVLVPVEGEGK